MSKELSRRSLLAAIGGAVAGGGMAGYKSLTERTVAASDVTVLGHRGAAGVEPHNTEAGIRRAADVGADGVELDVQKTGDGRLILFHDPVYNASTDNGSGVVGRQSYDEVKSYTIDGEPLLTLEEGLSLCRELGLDAYLGLKSANLATDTISVAEEQDWKERTTLMSLDLPYLSSVPNYPRRGYVTAGPVNRAVDVAVANSCESIATHYIPALGHGEFVSYASEKGLDVGIWALVDGRIIIQDALSHDIDFIITNHPDIALDLLNR